MASSTENKFPVPKFHFTVDLGSGPIAFQEVTGLDMENDHMEYRSGDDPEFVTLKRAGLRKTGTISFKKGVFTDDTDMWDNYKTIIDDKNYYSQSEPVDLTVTLLDESGGTVVTWTIAKAVAVKMTNGDLKSEENAIAIEQIDFVHSGIIQV